MAWGTRPNLTTFMLPVFDGGLNTKAHSTDMPLHQSPDLQNVSLDDYGAVGTNNGFAKYNTEAVGGLSAIVDGLHSFVHNSGTVQLLAAAGGSIWRCSGTTFVTIASSQSQYTAGQDVCFLTVEDNAFITNGYVKPYKYTYGGDFVQVGVSAPTSGTVSAVSDGTGALNGTYRWWMTGINSANVEGDYAPITSANITITNGQVTITGIPVYPTSAGVATKYIYRNTAGATTVPLRVTSIANAVTNITDNNADSTLVTSAPSDNGTPPYCKYMIEHRNRVFGAGNPTYPHRLFYSNAGDPEIWPSTNYIDVGNGDGKPITGLCIFGNSLVIHKNSGKDRGDLWLLYMPDTTGATDDTNWYLEKSPSAYGGNSHKAQTFFSNLLFFFNKYGAYAFQGQDIALSSTRAEVGAFRTDSHTFDIEPDIFTVNSTYLAKAAAITYKNRVWLSVPYNTSTANNRVYLYDFVRASNPDRTVGGWTRLTDMNINNFCVHEGELYGGSATANGFVYKLDTGTSYDGSAIDSYYLTAPISGKEAHRNHVKVFRYLYVTVETSGDWNMYVNYILDFMGETGNLTSVDLSPTNRSKWDQMVLDTDEWGVTIERRRVQVVLQEAVGTAIQFKFWTNTVDQYWKVHEIEVAYSLRGKQ